MSDYYHGKRTTGIYKPGLKASFKLSRSRIDLFIECPRCFYIDRRLGVDRPPGFPFTINSAIDALLKKEFDLLRGKESTHPLIEEFKIDARPVAHDKLNVWRENFKGVQFLHEPTNFLVTGAIDDLWINSKNEYIVVDYKATAKSEPVKELGERSYHYGYRRQLEVYQWLLRGNGLKVSDTGYFLYCTGRTGADQFDGKVEFDMNLIAHEGKTDWIEPTLKKIKQTLDSDTMPDASPGCDYCVYVSDRVAAAMKNHRPASLTEQKKLL